ncbi:site-specific DNA-methyltransferase [Paracoccus haeundaensis]|uniref:site-specific DNA-methyltransferase (adenine-specific) n=1 Tax=Paracoccus haeundaensis TaxID=225362 RepID=A0A5C4R3J5_9RHOB|nr:site-specific DNA-methyltransferase [Paracoccus haeundaensis]TNH38324.1 site-specific DNA-methyltransferase [Paracoccus haeundaensis]
MAAKTKLELTWIGKDNRPRLEPRILIEESEFSHHASTRRKGDIFDNMLIHGDNLLALKALETDPAVRGKVKCIFIDPPYNTGSAFEHYDDGLEHSLWLTMMRDRLEILKNLLSADGSIWVSVDDNEGHYLKVLMDEVFGRKNFLSTIIWQKIYTIKNSAKHFSDMHDFVMCYAKNVDIWTRNDIPRSAKQDDAYKNPDNDARGPWKATPIQARNYYSKGIYEIRTPSGKIISGPPPGTFWRISESNFLKLDDDNRIWWGKNGSNTPAQKRFLSEVTTGVVPTSLWLHEVAGHNAEAKNEINRIFQEEGVSFLTPKPERLIERLLHIASNPGDLVLDSFAGSGTTGAVAHKMGRQWIMVELGEHAKTHIVPRMQKVIDGTDKGGVTEANNWKGGGGYRFFRLAPSLLQKDIWGNWVISKDYNAEMLAEAMCKHFNYVYAPSTEAYWMHGQASENAFIYVTTASLTIEQLRAISDEVGEDRSLLICCMAYEAQGESLTNLTLKKIPRVVLDRCEWGHDDYSLKINTLPMAEDEPDDIDDTPAPKKLAKAKAADTPDLFGAEED